MGSGCHARSRWLAEEEVSSDGSAAEGGHGPASAVEGEEGVAEDDHGRG